MTEQQRLMIGGRIPTTQDPILIPFGLFEMILGRTRRSCLNCEQEEQLEQTIICAQCGALIFPGDDVILGPLEQGTERLFGSFETHVIESGDIVRCTSPRCSANVQHHPGVWNGSTIVVPLNTRHHGHR